jgi:hypothetical protein
MLSSNLLRARGASVERFAIDALQTSCAADDAGATCDEGVFVSDASLHLCGTPDAIVSRKRERIVVEVKDTTRLVDNVLLNWVLQCHVYMLLSKSREARLVVKQHKAWSPYCPAQWLVLRVFLDRRLERLLRSTCTMTPNTRVERVLAECSKSTWWTSCVSDVSAADDDFVARSMASPVALDVRKLRASIGASCAFALKSSGLSPKLRINDLNGLEASFYYAKRGVKHAGGARGSERDQHAFAPRDGLAAAGIAFGAVQLCTLMQNHVQLEIVFDGSTAVVGHLVEAPLAPHAAASGYDMTKFNAFTFNRTFWSAMYVLCFSFCFFSASFLCMRFICNIIVVPFLSQRFGIAICPALLSSMLVFIFPYRCLLFSFSNRHTRCLSLRVDETPWWRRRR